MRAYYFGNLYLSSIQQGIQALHATTEMFVKYGSHDHQVSQLVSWAEDHRTVILLNGTFHQTINELVEFFDNPENLFPWAPFYEGKEALDGVLTTVGIVLPERIYDMVGLLRDRYTAKQTGLSIDVLMKQGEWVYLNEDSVMITTSFSKWEVQLIERIMQFNLAN